MSWAVVLQMVLMVVTLLMEYLGGGSFDKVFKEQVRPMYLADYQWECTSPYWEKEATVVKNTFSGTVALKCDVEGIAGEGLIGLRRHMLTELPFSVSEVKAGPLLRSLEGLPSNAYDVAVDIQTEEELVKILGMTDIATDGFTRLRNVFESTATPTEGNARFLKYVRDEVDVIPSDVQDWYEVTLRSTTEVARPWFVSEEKFKNELKKNQEERLVKKRERVVNDVAVHL